MSEVKYKLDESVITINGKAINMPYTVAQVLICDDMVIVRVEPVCGEIFNTNIYGFTVEGNCKWQIEESPHGTEADKPYTSIFLSEDNKLIAGSWSGVDYIVDLCTGGITTVAFNKQTTK